MTNEKLGVGSVCAATIDGKIIYGQVLRWNGDEDSNLTIVDFRKRLYHPLVWSCYVPGASYRGRVLLTEEDAAIMRDQFTLMLADEETRRSLEAQMDAPVRWVEVRGKKYRPDDAVFGIGYDLNLPPSPGAGSPVREHEPLRIHRRDAGDGGPPDFTRTFERYIDDALFGEEYRDAWDRAFVDLYRRHPDQFDAVMAHGRGMTMAQYAEHQRIAAAAARKRKQRGILFLSERLMLYADGAVRRAA